MKQRVRKARTAERLNVPEIAVPLNMEPMKLASPSPRNSCSRLNELVRKTKRGQALFRHEIMKEKKRMMETYSITHNQSRTLLGCSS